jgi:polyisoprenoid-binding protein YceI
MGRPAVADSSAGTPMARMDLVAPAQATYEIDTDVSELRFRARAFTRFWVRGTMPVAEGSVRFTDGRVSGDGQIAADRLSTGLAPRDWHLRSSHYLHTARHPRIRVSVADTAVGSPFECTVVVRGASCTVPLTVDAVELDEEVLRVTGHLLLDRRPLPMLPPIAGVSRLVEIELELLARRVSVDEGDSPP